MSIKINDNIISQVMNDDDFKEELREYLNEVIDDEIAKGDDMDDELVHDCVEALMALSEGTADEAVDKLRSSKNVIRFVHRKNFAAKRTRRQIAAAIAVLLIAHTTAYNTVNAYANAVDEFFSSIVEMLRDIDKEDDTNPDIEHKYASMWYEPPESGEITSVKNENDIDLSGYSFFVSDYEGNEKEVPLSDCKIIKEKAEADGKPVINVVVKYENVECPLQFILEDN